MQCWGLLGAMGSPAGALARGLRRDAPAPVVASADVVGVLLYEVVDEVVDAAAGALAPVVVAIAAAALSCTVALRAA